MLKNEYENDNKFQMNEYIPFVILHSLGSILGLAGSIAIFAAILVTKELRTSTYYLISNISLADFILSAFIDPLAIAGIIF